MQPVRVGMLGLGQRGLQHLCEVWQLQAAGLAQVVALADVFTANLDLDKLQTYAPGLQADNILRTTSFDELLARGGMDALYICIPPNLHQGEVVRAAQAGLHLFVEKPMSLFLDEAIAMQQAMAEAGILSSVGFQLRFDPRHEAIHAWLADKRVVMATYTHHAPIEAHNVKHTVTETLGGPANRVWTASRAWSGTTLVEAGIHLLDVWRYWMGDVAWVQAMYIDRRSDEIIDGADNPYAYSVQFGFASGAVGVMTLSRLRRVFHTHTEHQVLWNEGRLALEGHDLVGYFYDGDYPPTTTPTSDAVRHRLTVRPGDNATYAINRAFLEAIALGQPDLIRSPFGDAMNSLAAVLAANVSDALGGQRVYVEELLTGEKYSSFRTRPVK